MHDPGSRRSPSALCPVQKRRMPLRQMAMRVENHERHSEQTRHYGKRQRTGPLRFYLSERENRADRGA